MYSDSCYSGSMASLLRIWNQRIAGPYLQGQEKGFPGDYPAFDPVTLDKRLKGAAIPLRQLGMALSCASLISHLGSGIVRGDSFNPKAFCWIEKSQQQP
jgi:hypothetical protein